MRVAAIYDLHGNIDALDAVLAEAEAEGVDRMVIGGDIAWGAFPAETVARVRSLDAVFLRGNADREVAARAGEADGLEPWVAGVNRWCADQLDPEQRRFLGALQQTDVIGIDGLGDVLFCHGTPRSDDEIMTEVTPDGDVEDILRDVEQEVVVCGHTHSQFDRQLERHRVVNAGSVGLPYEDAPGAYWAIVGPDVTLKRTEYDFMRAAARILESGCPEAQGFADAVTSPLPRPQAIETFEARRRRS